MLTRGGDFAIISERFRCGALKSPVGEAFEEIQRGIGKVRRLKISLENLKKVLDKRFLK